MMWDLYKQAKGNPEATARFRKIPPRTAELSDERQDLALTLARKHHQAKQLDEAEVWALRALQDGPSIDALALLGDICEDDGDLESAHRWYRLACSGVDRRRYDAEYFDPAAQLDAIERQLREDWQSRVPMRQLQFTENPQEAYRAFPTWETAVMDAAKRGEPAVGGPGVNDGSMTFHSGLQMGRLDNDLAFIAWKPGVKIASDIPDQLLILPVREAPLFGDVLTIAPWAARRITVIKQTDAGIAAALPSDAKFGAFCGPL